ncbi:MAG: HDIG domain-containing protein [Thermodesulfobacteriota bacterium]|nr:HDIG domain-containing protein [Thermodesulfobacteriota bacterium]
MASKQKAKHNSRQTIQHHFLMSAATQKRLLLLGLAALLTLIIVPKGGFVPNYYSSGDIASHDIKAPRGFLVPEPALTEKKKQDAEQSVVPVYDYDPRPSKAVADNLAKVLQLLNTQAGKVEELADAQAQLHAGEAVPIVAADGDAGNGASIGVDGVTLVEVPPPVDAKAILGVELDDEHLAALSTLALDDDFVGHFSSEIRKGLDREIVGNLVLFQSNWRGAISVRNLATQQEFDVVEADNVLGLEEVVSALNGALFSGQQPTDDALALVMVVQKLIKPNLTFNQSETENRRRAAAEAVFPVLQQVKCGEMIVREGERVTEEQIRKLRALQSSADGVKILRSAFGIFLAILLAFFSLHRFAKLNISKYDLHLRDLLFLALVFSSFIVVAKVGIFISTAMQSTFPYVDSACYYYALPFAAGAMLVRVVLNSEVAYVFAMLFALLIGMLFGNNLYIIVYVLVGSVTAAHWVRHSKARSNLYRAGWYLSLVNMLMVLAIFSLSDHVFDIQLVYRLGFAFVGGFGCAIVVNGTVPIMESLFKYTTDFKLLELADMNTPILRELMIQAPGTYHHSIIVGNLVENAAEAIGANPILARVAAYYHDIGKIKKPLYFAENMRLSENRHDKLAPSMSALILISHVKDGVELAREHKLGQNLIDIIRQHHGTALIKFFYDKAQQCDKNAKVKEQDYRYPGPKPQTREAALIMLADSVEAAGRTLSEPTPARIQGMVQKIINKIFIDGQLDECELTLKDLHEIAKSFNRILSGIFHHRVDYPEPAYKERDKEPKKESKRKSGDDLHREPAREPRHTASGDKNGSEDDLKRLGMS